jgi:site-specific recombinase XerD
MILGFNSQVQVSGGEDAYPWRLELGWKGWNIMWDEAVETYLDTHRDSTAAQYRRALEDFHEWYVGSYGEEPEPKLLTNEEARDWRSYLSGVKDYAASTVNVRLSALKGLVQHAGGRLDVEGVKAVDKPVKSLTARELGRLVRAIEQHRWGPDWLCLRNVALVAVMARAGLRVGEALALDLADVEINERSGWATVREGKGLKERVVPLSLQARKALTTYLEQRPNGTNALFVTMRGNRLSKRTVQDMVTEAARRAGIEQGVTPHTLRHTFATRFLEQGGDLATLRDILGHANLTTTSRYVHSNATKMQKMVERL